MFQAVVALDNHYEVHMTSYNPQKTRLMLLNAREDSDVIRVEIYYPKPQRLDVYVNGKYVHLICHLTLSVLGYKMSPKSVRESEQLKSYSHPKLQP